MELLRLIEAGGFVMWPLLLLSLACVAVILERAWAFRAAPQPARLVAEADSPDDVQLRAQKLTLSLERNLPLLATTATMAPLLGLLGTVTGMITTFNALSRTRAGGNTDLVLRGIGEALYATAAGILVALVALAFYNLFQARLRRLLAEVETEATAWEVQSTPLHETADAATSDAALDPTANAELSAGNVR